MKYRIIHNGKIYRIQWRHWWFPAWSMLEPSRWAYYRPIDWSKYKFDTIEQAKERIDELKQLDKERNWSVVSYE